MEQALPTGLDTIFETLNRLGKAPKYQADGSILAQCPAHDDRNPSFTVTVGRDGRRVVAHCFAGCSFNQIQTAIGADSFTWFGDEPQKAPSVIAEYKYADEDGQLLYTIQRLDNKQFRAYRTEADGHKNFKLNGVRRVLYRLPQILAAIKDEQTIYVVEGEKDANNLVAKGYAATTAPFGAGKWNDDYAKSLEGADVIIIADKDEPGLKHGEEVYSSLYGIAKKAQLTVPKVGKDVTDMLNMKLGLDQLVSVDPGIVMPETPNTKQESSYTPLDLSDVLNGNYQRLEPELLSRVDGNMLLYPGRLHVCCAEPEFGKTWLMLWACTEAAKQGRSFIYMDYETDEFMFTQRMKELQYDGDWSLVKYVKPQDPFDEKEAQTLHAVIDECDPAIIVIDAVTAAMQLQGGLDPTVNKDVASFYEMLPRWASNQGPAVVLLDHLPKQKGEFNRYAFGAQHKLAYVDVQFSLQKQAQMRVGEMGSARINIDKDRPGSIRSACADGRYWGLAIFDSNDAGEMAISIDTPEMTDGGHERPVKLMNEILAFLVLNPNVTGRKIRENVRGRNDKITSALTELIRDGSIQQNVGAHKSFQYRVSDFGPKTV